MALSNGLSIAEVQAAFTNEIADRQGEVTDVYKDDHRLFARSVLPRYMDVKARDRLQAGVALKACDGDVSLYPYLFRLVCKNGAIFTHTLEVRRLEQFRFLQPDAAIERLREAVEAVCAEEVFSANVLCMRKACNEKVDLALSLMPMLSRLAAGKYSHLLADVLDRFFSDGDTSRFGLANAVTATARDIREPEVRWDLEELGGGIAAGLAPTRPTLPGWQSRKLQREFADVV